MGELIAFLGWLMFFMWIDWRLSLPPLPVSKEECERREAKKREKNTREAEKECLATLRAESLEGKIIVWCANCFWIGFYSLSFVLIAMRIGA